ncbi:MAG: hypothetical protein U0M96_05175 [Eggerthellaceae bacterium]
MGTFTYGTTTVKHQTGMETMTLSSTEHLATGWCYFSAVTPVSANQVGVMGEIYNPAGLLLKSTKIVWNTGGEQNQGAGASLVCVPGARYFAGGRVYISRTHIESMGCYQSPILTCSTGEVETIITPEEYQINDHGETYGSLMFANEIGEEPDLIAVLATNNKEGYIYSEDFNNVALDDGLAEDSTIPVYDKNGLTLIGEFELDEPRVA